MAGSYSTRSSYQSYFCILGFLPTIGELVQADIPQNIDGISYLPTLTGKGTQKEHDCIYYEFFEFGGKQSIMTPDGWKLVRRKLVIRLKPTKNCIIFIQIRRKLPM